ncbi:MAG: PAS domain S-box protein [Candidatus Thermoplasmatota archaeon]|jgi:PAS domain S-box-containing protein|nr:PAS domain S-box protein [Candidatus Thermoplasmatota archaeon]
MKLKTILIVMFLSVSTIPIGLIIGLQGFNESILFLILIFVVTFYFSLLLSHLIIHPIKSLTMNLDKISKGQLNVKLEKSEIYEINNLIESLNRIMASLKLAIYKFGVKKGEIFDYDLEANGIINIKKEEVFGNIPGWLWKTNSSGIITFCSENVFDYLSYHPEELIGMNIFDLMVPEDVKKSKNIFDEARKKKESIKNLENWVVQKNGKRLCIRTNADAFYDESGNIAGFNWFNLDVTEEKHVKEKIKKLNEEYLKLKTKIDKISNERKKEKNRLFETIDISKEKSDEKWIENEGDFVFTFDKNAKILDCNENMYKKLGYNKNEILSLNLTDFDILETKQSLSKKISNAIKNGVYSNKTIYKKKDGSTILVFENLQYLKDQNAFKCIVKEDDLLKNIQK